MEDQMSMDTVPVWKRFVLTIPEAADYYHIGEKKLRAIAENNLRSEFVIMNGNRVLIKRKQFEEFLENASCL